MYACSAWHCPSSQLKEGEGPDLLKDLLEAGVITQEEYETLDAARQAAKPEQSANGESNSATSEESSTDTSSAEETGNL